jgi:hypothetical protein
MNRIIFPLEFRMRGPQVADLQEALQLLLDRAVILADNHADRHKLSEALRRARAENIYEEATQKIVSTFQEERNLEEREGNVGEQTANALNALLKEWGLLDEGAPADNHRMVGGQVRREDGQPLPGVVVRAFHVGEPGILRLREDTTDAEGRYTIRYSMLPGVNILHLRIAAFDADGKPLSESDVIREAKLLEMVDLVVPDMVDTTFQVEGRVASRVSAGISGLRVRVVDKAVGEDVPLAEDDTDEDGAYQVRFTDAEIRRRGKERPDLQARVFSGETFLAASEVHYNASTRETLNVLLDKTAAPALRSEHETLTTSLHRHSSGRLGNLKEEDGRQDVTYLANKAGWDARAVALAALADQFSTRTTDTDGNVGIESAFFYALFRAGLPADDAALYQTDANTAAAIWKQAITQGVIPARMENQIPEAVERFQFLAAEQALDGPALVGVSPLREMLAVSLSADPQKQRQFADLYVRHGGELPAFWTAVRSEFGEPAERRLRVDGQLAYLTLNNAQLIGKLHAERGGDGLEAPLNLVEGGYHRREKWQQVIGDVPIPPEVPGEDDAEKRDRYAELLAAQVRLSFPTAVVAQMVKTGETSLTDGLADPVHRFLMNHQGKFEIGMQPVEQYVAQNNLGIEREVVREVTRIQRVYQITPSDDAMNVLLEKGVDSAYAVVRYDRDEFVKSFKDEVGGEADARLIYAKAEQVHNAVLNIAVSYLTASNAPGIGVHSPAQIINPAPTGPAPHASDVIAYSTLENLFGEMDFCACEHCRSILSPAAYLVDLLLFCDRVNNEKENPQKVLFERRPDIQHLPLTCENTNIQLPYIDLVNETLEFFVANGLKLKDSSGKDYKGYSTNGDASQEELAASPQFGETQASVAAYKILSEAPFPPPLPFHQPLENLRRYFNKFHSLLPEVMEALRKHDSLERTIGDEHGWRDILMEELRLSRAEYALLTDGTLTLQQIYGYAPGDDVVAALSKLKDFTRRVGISYEDIIQILKTRFVNPHSTLIPKVERLGISFAKLKELKESTETGQEWLELLPSPLPDASKYGGNIESWVKNQTNYNNIMGLITVADLTTEENPCNFDELEFRYTDPEKSDEPINGFEFLRLIRFIRLWKKLGWTIEQTDKAIAALYPATPAGTTDTKKLDNGFLTLLPRLGIVKRIMDALELKPNRDLLLLLACFAPIDTHGAGSLYRQMFLSPALLKQHPVFDDDGYGNFLTDNGQKLVAHAEALRAAFQLTEGELNEITDALGYDADTLLTVESVSAVFRRGWLARKLKLSAREFRYLTTYNSESTPPATFTDLDPFAPPDPPNPPILRLIELVNRLRNASLDPAHALYLIWNEDISGKSAPDDAEITGFARTLRSDLAAIDAEFAIADDPEGSIARARMALVYGNATTDQFFGLLENTYITEVEYSRSGELITEVPYTHHQTTLDQAILDAAPNRIGYDDNRKRLSYKGTLSTTTRDALKAVARVTAGFQAAVDYLYAENQEVIQANLEQMIVKAAPGRIAYNDFRKRLSFTGVMTTTVRDALQAVTGVTSQFQAAVGKLYVENERALQPFFASYPELRPLYDAYVASNNTVVAYNHGQPSLEQAILDAASGRIAYDDVRKKLSYRGRLTNEIRDELKDVSGVTAEFKAAVDYLYAENQKVVTPLLSNHPELSELYDALVASGESPGKKRATLIEHLVPKLKRRRKRQKVLQVISAAVKSDVASASDLLENKLDNRYVLHMATDSTRPALDDLTALETPGLSAQFFFRNTATGAVDHTSNAEANLSYSDTGSNKLPDNRGNPVSGIWQGYLEAPENGFYNLRVEADAGATVALALDGREIALAQNQNIWSNSGPIEFTAGTLYVISLKVEKVKDKLIVRWETTERRWEVIPPRYLYNSTQLDYLRQVYVRFLKAASLAAALKLTTAEIAYLASHADYRIGGQSWLNSLPVVGTPNNTTTTALLKALNALLEFARLKAEVSPNDERLLTILKAPASAAQDSASLLYTLTRWEPGSLTPLLAHFGKAIADLAHLDTFSRLYDAYDWIKKMGIPAAALINATTNEPDANTVRDLQASLRARYDEGDWLDVLKPINDEMRGLQRNALVAYILHQMRENEQTKHIDTPDKLFEYFLMDVQMDSCMQTSRIRHALSSVQLFIERCLMNLEPRVDPSSITAEHWQ